MKNHFLIAGVIKYIYFAIVDCVLLAVGGNHSTDIISRTIAREICVIYDDIGYSEVSEMKSYTFILSIRFSKLLSLAWRM